LLNTYLGPEAVKRLRHGAPWAYRDEILSIEGEPSAGEPVRLLDEQGHSLGLADLDLKAPLAIRRLGLPSEPLEGLLQRHLRHALGRRAFWLEDNRYCRLINDDGDGLPGLLIDRYDDHYVVQPLTRAMDARVEEIAQSLRVVMNASSVLLRTDTPLREREGLEVKRPHVLLGRPPRWTRVFELGARMTCDLFSGPGTGYPYDERPLRRLLARMSYGAHVLEVNCRLGGLFVHAGLHGASQIVAGTEDPSVADLARENVEANGLTNLVRIERVTPRQQLEQVEGGFDLVLMRAPELTGVGEAARARELGGLLALAVRATRRGGRLVLAVSSLTLAPRELEDAVAQACEAEGRLGYALARPGMAGDFPTALASPGNVSLNMLILEVD
jgi:23S rRNA (cytosine1962-C5)-methyltransferase